MTETGHQAYKDLVIEHQEMKEHFMRLVRDKDADIVLLKKRIDRITDRDTHAHMALIEENALIKERLADAELRLYMALASPESAKRISRVLMAWH